MRSAVKKYGSGVRGEPPPEAKLESFVIRPEDRTAGASFRSWLRLPSEGDHGTSKRKLPQKSHFTTRNVL
jgi:hypothetical protein